jgi:release factor glutamine methyltransferase
VSDRVPSDDGTVAWQELIDEASRSLAAAGFASAEVDARRIVEQVSGLEGSELTLARHDPATRRGVAGFDRLLARRLSGEPLQYVLGSWGFRRLDLFVDRRVLIPRPETETVVEHALAELDRLASGQGAEGRPLTVVDLGTGSGAIALSFALERPGVDVWATDVSEDALAVARANLAGIGRAAAAVRLVAGSWFDALPDSLRGEVDLVVSNPPYVAASDELPAEVADWEPTGALIAGPTGREALEVIVVDALDWLREPGAVVVELAPGQAGAVVDLARASGYASCDVRDDLTGRERLVIARR